ncbi:hypothetical protein [Nocardioides sp.]|uniref:hypothetical protein n=1 Tax=Nocardioides sp. TaxID=35761 RepID=UPI002ED519A8
MSEFLERARAAATDGRLPVGAMPGWEVFPFEADSVRVRPLEEYADPEPDRRKKAADCKVCQARGRQELVLHEGDHLTVIRTDATSLLFTANVVSHEHAPLDDLTDQGLAELGLLVGRTFRALKGLPEVGNVHINKWENGSGHLAVVLLARPRGVLQLRGSNLPIWADMLPPIPDEEYAERADRVRRALA